MTRSRSLSLVLLATLLALSSVVTHDYLDTRRSKGRVTVLGPWTSDAEKEPFLEVLREFQRKTGIGFDYQGTTALREVLLAQVQAGTPPDIAVLPSPGELAGYAVEGDLRPLDDLGHEAVAEIRDAYGHPWMHELDTAKRPSPHFYWFPVKADLKSAVWYDPQRFPGRPQPTAQDFGQEAGNGAKWCLGMGADATSGWPGTDWIEDILLHRSGPEVYEQWAAGELGWRDRRVADAWRTWGEIVSANGPDPEIAALGNYFEDVGAGMFREKGKRPTCVMEHQGSFLRTQPKKARADFVDSSQFIPSSGQSHKAFEVSGDFAGMFSDSRQAKELMRYLAEDSTQKFWAEKTRAGPHPFSANRKVSALKGDDEVSKRITAVLRDRTRTLCFDASDMMPPPMRSAFQRAVLEFLADRGELDKILKDLESLRKQVRNNGTWLASACS